MVKIYDVAVNAVQLLRPVVEDIERHDRNLGEQLRRAASSMVLNLSEGTEGHGRNRGARYRIALGSTKEVKAGLDVALAFGYVGSVDSVVRDRLDHVAATLWKLTRR